MKAEVHLQGKDMEITISAEKNHDKVISMLEKIQDEIKDEK